MAVTFQLPQDIESNLRHQFGDLSQAAKEAALVELYRQQKLTHHELSRALGMTRLGLEEVLKRHHVVEDLPTEAEHDNALTRLANNPRS